MQTDSLFYELFQICPPLLFELIGQANPNAESYTFRSVELKQTASRIDGVFWPENSNTIEAPVYFVEVQFQRDEQLYGRLFTEVMLFLRQNPSIQYWNVVVIYGTRSCEPRETRAHTALLTLPQVRLIYLDELAEIADESLEFSLVRLIVESPPRAIERAQQLVQRAQKSPSRLSPSVIIEMVETIIVYKFPHLSWQEVEAMFGLSELKQTRVYRQGREEGREEGRESEARLIVRLFTRRFGSLPDSARSHVAQLPLERLEELGEALLDFSSLEDLQSWLSIHCEQKEL